MLPYLSKDDIKIGMSVRTYQLANIYDTHFLIAEPKLVEDDSGFRCITEGTVVFIGDEQDAEYWKIRNKYANDNKKILALVNTDYDGVIV